MRIPHRSLMVVLLGWLLCAGCAEVHRSRFGEVPPANRPNLALRPQAAFAVSKSPVKPIVSPNPVKNQVAPASPAPTNSPQATVDPNPKLAPGDVLDVKVYQEDDLTSRVRVNGDGTVMLPLLGAIPVAGKTSDQASEYIRAALERDYLFNPHVTLSVAEFAKKRFSVMGEVKAPGFYLIPENEQINVLQALSMAGGYTAFSRGTRIQVKRIVGGKETVLWVDAKAMARDKNVAPVEVLPGDAITVNSNIF